MQDFIIIKGAREHNLKNIDVAIPRDKITVITGPSGSGKSSLAIDTIYAEGQRRYVESLSAYARQFLEQMQKPEVDSIEGLSPSIAINQKTVSRSPRSTVGTITEIYDYMRVLFTRIGTPYCYSCGSLITTQDIHNILKSILALPLGTKIQILAPIVRERKGEYKKELRQMRMEGFIRARIDGKMVDLTRDISLRKTLRHTIEIVIDRFIIKHSIEKQLKHAIDVSLKYADTVIINIIDEEKDIPFSRTLACAKCGISYPEIEPRLFSFNSKYGACPSCSGLGYEGIVPVELSGSGEQDLYLNGLENMELTHMISCKSCGGKRLRKEALHVRIHNINIGEFSGMSVKEASEYIAGITSRLSDKELTISRRIIKEVSERLTFLERVGLGYVTLDRASLTLSGGEAQRIRLATQLGSSLTGVLYVLDEPSIGLHPRDCSRLLDSLSEIRDAGNTVVIVEHDEDTIRWADHVIDMGPGAGSNGGWVIATGSPRQITRMDASITGKYLSCDLSIPIPKARRGTGDWIRIIGASEFNLKNIDVAIPLGVFVCVTGVSGSGKSTLIFEILYKYLMNRLYKSNFLPGKCKKIEGIEKLDRAISIDQSPLGRTPRSNPATYTGIFTYIRNLFAQISESRVRGYSPSRFSFNVSGGRCENCQGDGQKKIEMHFLPNIYVTCDVCKGARYNKETLDIRYRDRNIAEILDMTISDALDFFSAIPPLRQRLAVLDEVGLGYLKLGQSATTLSGGEAQRLKISRELGKRPTGKTLYILDEPTTGLHFVDISKLLGVINRLVEMGNTVIVIEHDLDIIKSADYIIDLGPEGGDGGGDVIATGTPEDISKTENSFTGRFLRNKISGDCR
ncbi:MAG TPA: excinuclease ABC subunit UvrA [Dissulfurispiraceae bacterium]|nr:excinuclease ABC subunit UvrA [Dissulfurispiraceae bacterium]